MNTIDTNSSSKYIENTDTDRDTDKEGGGSMERGYEEREGMKGGKE